MFYIINMKTLYAARYRTAKSASASFLGRRIGDYILTYVNSQGDRILIDLHTNVKVIEDRCLEAMCLTAY